MHQLLSRNPLPLSRGRNQISHHSTAEASPAAAQVAEWMKTSICQNEQPTFQTTLLPAAADSITKHGPIQYLPRVRVLHVRLCTVCNAALQHLLHTGHQEDLHVWVSHRENPLQEAESRLSDSRTPDLPLPTARTAPASVAAADGPWGLTRLEHGQVLKSSTWSFACCCQ